MPQPLRIYPALAFLFITVLATGIFFRMAGLDRKVYWHDEVFTTLRAAGYLGKEAEQTLYTGEVLRPDQLLQFQTLDPERGWSDTLAFLKTHPEHPPFYYLLVRLWMNGFGSAIATVRSLSVVFALLTFPALYWLGLELFESPLVGWLAIALYAVSPFHVLYAQEARQYSLWTLATVLMCAALLRAMRLKAIGCWVVYAVTVALGLYTSLFSVLVSVTHGLYVLALEYGRPFYRPSKTVVVFLMASLIGMATFIPWARVMIQNWGTFQSKTEWTKASQPLSYLAKLWGLHLSSAVVDWGLPLDHLYTYVAPALVLVLVGYALYVLCRQTPRSIWLLVVLLIGIPAIALILPDLILGGQRSASTRYFVPPLVGVLLALAYLLAHLLTHPIPIKQRLGQALAALLFTLGVISCALSLQADTWWSKGVSYGIPETADFLNALPSPLVIVSLRDVSLGNSIALSYQVQDSVRFQLLDEPLIPTMPEDVSDRFLFYPADDLIQAFETASEFTVEPLGRDNIPLLRLRKQD